MTEGITALVAAVVLLYMGFWMHNKSYANRWQTFLQEQLRTALSARTMWALALVSFLAVYREAFETVLFYQALWTQAAPAYAPCLVACWLLRDARRARVAALTRQYPSPSRAFSVLPRLCWFCWR